MSAKDKLKNGDKQFQALNQAITELADNKSAMNRVLDAGESFFTSLELLVNESGAEITDSVCDTVEQLFGDYTGELEKSDKKISKLIKNTSMAIEIGSNNGWSIEDVVESAVGKIPPLPFDDIKKLIGLDQLREGRIYDELLGNDEDVEVLKKKFEELRQLEEYVKQEEYTPVWYWLRDHKWSQRVEKEDDGTESPFTLKGCLTYKIYEQANSLASSDHQKQLKYGNLALEWDSLNTEPDLDAEKHHIDEKVILKKLRAAFWADTNFQPESPLLRVLIAGHLGLGQLIKMQQLVRRRRSSASAAVSGLSLGSQSGYSEELQNQKEVDPSSSKVVSNPLDLTQEIEVPDIVGGHPIHVCPVLRQMTGKQNIALALPCGHIVSGQALDKLASGSVGEMRSSRGGPLGRETVKCPYCPQRSERFLAEPVVFVEL